MHTLRRMLEPRPYLQSSEKISPPKNICIKKYLTSQLTFLTSPSQQLLRAWLDATCPSSISTLEPSNSDYHSLSIDDSKLSLPMERSEEAGSAMDAASDTEMAAGGGDDDVDEVGCDQEETSKETHGMPLPTEWTDEKHSLYLKSIEASFVDQLYNSMGFPGFEASRKSSIVTKPHFGSSVRTSAGQFKTLRGGSWQKINVGKGEVQLDGQNSSHALFSNQWIRHYRHLDRHHLAESTASHGKAAAIDQEINSRGKASLPYRFSRSLRISNSVPSNSLCPVFTDDDTEASGQNFTNEDIVEEKCSTLCSSARVRSQAAVNDLSRNDQIVP